MTVPLTFLTTRCWQLVFYSGHTGFECVLKQGGRLLFSSFGVGPKGYPQRQRGIQSLHGRRVDAFTSAECKGYMESESPGLVRAVLCDSTMLQDLQLKEQGALQDAWQGLPEVVGGQGEAYLMSPLVGHVLMSPIESLVQV